MVIGMTKLARVLLLPALAALAVAAVALAQPPAPPPEDAGAEPSLEALAARAVHPDEAIADRAIAALRAHGPGGHAVLLRQHRDALARLRDGHPADGDERLRRAIDRVSGQRDGHSSGLYWYTDLDEARREARRRGRPILSLRLLGRLDEELSCANSRFFRTVLYADAELAGRLRDRFVLHWSSERPAPRIEIDMGDGRRIVRTITGNSVHYVLDAEGRPIDAIVGLYGPRQMARMLEDAAVTHAACRSADDRAACLAERHAEAERRLEAGYRAAEAGPGFPSYRAAIASLPTLAPSDAPSATAAMRLTVGKAVVETPALRMLQRSWVGPMEPSTEPAWPVVADAFDRAGPPSPTTVGLLRLKLGRGGTEPIAARMLTTARSDGARNELLFHRPIHGWFSAREAPESFEALNARVYRELLLTPASDPWLGLRADDLDDALEAAR